jgi:Lysozyme like domain
MTRPVHRCPPHDGVPARSSRRARSRVVTGLMLVSAFLFAFASAAPADAAAKVGGDTDRGPASIVDAAAGGTFTTAATGADLCAQVGYNAGWRDSALVTAVAIALAESGCSPSATGSNGPASGCPNGSRDRGLWQINDCYHSEVSDTCAHDAQCNANAAYRISSGGTSWTPWSTCNSGAYRSHLDEAQTAVERLNPTPSLPRRPLCRPVTGDWDGNGTTTIGEACKDGNGITWYLSNGFSGSPSYAFGFGNSNTCSPVTGDWNGTSDGSRCSGIGVACHEGHGADLERDVRPVRR